MDFQNSADSSGRPNVGLGCDGAAPSNLDLFDEMKALRYSMIAYWGLPSFNPVVMTCPTLLKMAVWGAPTPSAKAIYWELWKKAGKQMSSF